MRVTDEKIQQYMEQRKGRKRSPYQGIYEYCGIQRCGKSTKMMYDLVVKLGKHFKPEDCISNFMIFIEGIEVYNNEDLLQRIVDMKNRKETHKVVLYDECGQSLMARGYKKEIQTEIVSFAWQFPKRDLIWLYGSNIGNSTDIILRDATWVSVMPHYFSGETRDKDYIISDIIFNYDARVIRGVVTHGVCVVQEYYDTEEPID